VVGRKNRVIVELILGACMMSTPAAFAASSPSARSITIDPRVGIAGVRLDEKQQAVQRLLGKGQYQRRGTYVGYDAYRSGSITVFVSYGGGRADAINTNSRSALIYGRPLSQGLAKLKPVLRAHGWQIVSCQGETFTMLGQGGPGTGIAWRAGRLDDVQIDRGGSIGDACLPPF
jgi:hypothetical protein